MLTRLKLMLATVTIISLALAACGGSTTPDATATVQSPPKPTVELPSAGTRVEVAAKDAGGSGAYKFDPAELTFGVGETVEFTITSETEFHTFTVEELGIDEAIRGRETAVVSFTFSEAGTFKLICIPHEALGMVGTITVQ